MTAVRRFLIASSLARLIARERGSRPIIEGYFAAQQGRVSYVVQDGERSQLVLSSEPTGSALVEEHTDIPRAHAEALLAACAGRLTLERSALGIDGGAEVLIERIIDPGPLNTVTVEFHNEEEAEAFTPPAWFGHEITTEPSFGRQVISFDQMPDVGEVPLTNGIVEVVLDLLEGRGNDQLGPTPAHLRAVETSVFDALRRLSASVGSQTASPEAPEADPEPAMPNDINHEGTYVEAEEVSKPAQPDEARPAHADAPSRPSKIRPRLFARLTQ